MVDIVDISNENIKTAIKIIDELKIKGIWKLYKSNANLVGSVKTRLLMEHLDIDFHVYSESFNIQDSFSAVGLIAKSRKIEKVQYINNIAEEDKCIEWHLDYKAEDGRKWQIDLIHIMNESPYVGKFERVAEKINTVMTDQLRKVILQIKWELSKNNIKAMGIEVYKAVIEDEVSTYEEFLKWKETNQAEGIVIWEPTALG